MSQEQPLVSVVMPVYNGTSFVREAIASVMAQTYRHFEVIVVDDGSDDYEQLADIVASFPAKIRLLRQPHSGIAAALNHGISEMRGTLFAWLSHDDLYHPQKLEYDVQAFLDTQGKAIIYSNYCYIDEIGRLLGFVDIPSSPPLPPRALLLQHTWIHGCAMCIPKACLEAIGPFDPQLHTTQDYDLFFRVAAIFPFHHVARNLSAIRLHPHQLTHTANRLAIVEQDEMYAREVRLISSNETRFLASGGEGGALRYLYRRFTLGLLNQAASAARQNAWRRSSSVVERALLLFSVVTVNRFTRSMFRYISLIRGRPAGPRSNHFWRDLVRDGSIY
jgi:hypothetical protein